MGRVCRRGMVRMAGVRRVEAEVAVEGLSCWILFSSSIDSMDSILFSICFGT